MIITKEEGKIILESMEQCEHINGFMDDEDRELYKKIKNEFNFRRYYDKEQDKVLFI